MKKKVQREVPSKLADPELDLLAHLDEGYQLQTDSLGADPILRNLKNG